MKYLIPIAIVIGLISAYMLVQKMRNLGKVPPPPSQAAFAVSGNATRDPDAKAGAPLETPPLDLQLLPVDLKYATTDDILARLGPQEANGTVVNVRPDDNKTGFVLSGTDYQKLAATAEVIKKLDVASAIIGVRCLIVRDDSGKSLQEGLFAFLEGLAGENISSSWGGLLSGVSYDLVTGVASFGSAIAARHVLDLVVASVAGNNNFHVMAEPNISVLSGRTAVFSSGRKVPVPVTNRDVTGSQTSVQYEKAEFRFEVAPVLLSDGTVRLTIKQSNSDVLSESQISGDKVPVLSIQNLESQVDLREDQLLYLGGIEVLTESQNRRGVPVLRDIPGLGFIFGQKGNETKKSELSILLSVDVYKRGESVVPVRRAVAVDKKKQTVTKKPTKAVYVGN